MPKRSAAGSGSIIKKAVERNGKQYEYWEARFNVDGKRKTISGKTQKEVRQKLTSALSDVQNGTYMQPSKITLSAWLDIWLAEYLGDVKPRTVDSYTNTVKTHIKPELGHLKLNAITTPQIQAFYNGLQRNEGLAAKSIKNVHGVLHRALNDAVSIGYLKFNPSAPCKLPRIEKAHISPFDEAQIEAFLGAITGHRFENVYFVTLFCGLRQGEVLGLTWDCVDFKAGTILIDKQLQKSRTGTGIYNLVPPKNDKPRKLTPAPTVMAALKQVSVEQRLAKQRAGEAWNNENNLVFTNELGHNLSAQTVYLDFKKIAETIGAPDVRFHDLRHSYAVLALQSGDDIKTVQGNLGHHTAAFTLDTYAYVTEQMKTDSANRMEGKIAKLKQA